MTGVRGKTEMTAGHHCQCPTLIPTGDDLLTFRVQGPPALHCYRFPIPFQTGRSAFACVSLTQGPVPIQSCALDLFLHPTATDEVSWKAGDVQPGQCSSPPFSPTDLTLQLLSTPNKTPQAVLGPYAAEECIPCPPAVTRPFAGRQRTSR